MVHITKYYLYEAPRNSCWEATRNISYWCFLEEMNRPERNILTPQQWNIVIIRLIKKMNSKKNVKTTETVSPELLIIAEEITFQRLDWK